MRFTLTETEDGYVVRGADGEHLATFPDGVYNPAFIAFAQGLLSFDGAEIWNESTASYMVSYGRIEDEGILREANNHKVKASVPGNG